MRILKREMFSTSARVIASNASRYACRQQIWSTSISKGPPSIWLTINPDDLNDPIAAVFTGAQINLDAFANTQGPSAPERARAIAEDPYAAALFFTFIIKAVLIHLFGISSTGAHRVQATPGIYGRLSAYFGTVESQGRGTLHLHMLLWIDGAPDPDTMNTLLQDSNFRERVVSYIEHVFHATHPSTLR